MRRTRALGLLALIGLLGALAGVGGLRAQTTKPKGKAEKGKADKGKGEFANINDVQFEISALNVLSPLQLSPRQLRAIQNVAAKTMQKPPPVKKVKVSTTYLKTLRGLRDALLGDEDKQIQKLSAELDELKKKEDPEVDDLEVTSEARKTAPAVLRILGARQVAGYIGSVPEFPDPLEALRAGLRESRKLKGAEWQSFRDSMADEVGWLVGGVETDAEEKLREQAKALLNKAAKLTDKDFTTERSNLDKEARAIIGKLGPTDIIRHYMERVLAELLSNYRLAAVLEAKLKLMK